MSDVQCDPVNVVIVDENSELNKETPSEEKEKESDYIIDPKAALKIKLRQILCCAVCSELRRSAIFQCKHGHLICAGCFYDIILESWLQNEIAVCPQCQATISKEICSRNVAVEKTISELPMTCPYCSLEIPPSAYKTHKTSKCERRPKSCSNNSIGCSFEGPFNETVVHEGECQQDSASGYEILKTLQTIDMENEKIVHIYEKIFELFSVEKFSFRDLQFKKCCSDGGISEYETSKFSAFDNLWLVHGFFKEKPDPPEFHYSLISKSKLNVPQTLYYLLVRGPYSEMEIKPQLCQFKFTEKETESSCQSLSLWNSCESLEKSFNAKRVNFRIFMFMNK